MNTTLHNALLRARSYGLARWQRNASVQGMIIADLANRCLASSGARSDLAALLAWSKSWRSAQREIIRRYMEITT